MMLKMSSTTHTADTFILGHFPSERNGGREKNATAAELCCLGFCLVSVCKIKEICARTSHQVRLGSCLLNEGSWSGGFHHIPGIPVRDHKAIKNVALSWLAVKAFAACKACK